MSTGSERWSRESTLTQIPCQQLPRRSLRRSLRDPDPGLSCVLPELITRNERPGSGAHSCGFSPLGARRSLCLCLALLRHVIGSRPLPLPLRTRRGQPSPSLPPSPIVV